MLRICRSAYEAMILHVRSVYPEEGCGLLGGTDALACRHVAVPNVLHSASAYRMAPAAQVAAMSALEEAGEQLLALYHSHPGGPAWPSPRDVAEVTYPEAVMIIIASPLAELPELIEKLQAGAASIAEDMLADGKAKVAAAKKLMKMAGK